MAKTASTIVVVKGKNIISFDFANDAPDDETLLAHMLGPTGNLRAPTVRVGKTIFVGFNDEAYKSLLKM